MSCLLTIIIEAKHIPEGRVVRKIAGTKTYMMRRQGIKVYDAAGLHFYGAGDLHIQAEEHIQIVGTETRLAVDFECVADAEDFLEELTYGM